MAPHSSTLAWKIPWTEEDGGLQSMGSLRIGHDWATSLSLFTLIHWRRKWQPTPVFLPGDPRDGRAWWAAVYGVAQSQTRLKRLSSSSSSGLEEAQDRIKIARRNINNLRYADDTTLMAESEELKRLLMKVKEESEKVGLKFNIHKTKIMVYSPITSWQIDAEKVETVSDFISLGSKITADGDCSHEIKRCLLLGRKVMTNLDSILKSRDITLPTKAHLVKAMVFPVVTHVCESWTIKKSQCRRIYAFELWCWKSFLRVPWTARRSNQSILKEISTGCSLVGLILKLKVQYFGHLMRRADSLKKPWCWERLRAGGKGDDRGRDGWMASLTQWTWVWVDSGSWWRTGRPGVLRFMGSRRVGHDWTTELNRTELCQFMFFPAVGKNDLFHHTLHNTVQFS